MATRLRLKKDRCECCGASLYAGPAWFSVHDGPRTLRTCRPCLEDRLEREDAEARWQASELEFFWTLDAGRGDDGDADDDPRRRAPIP